MEKIERKEDNIVDKFIKRYNELSVNPEISKQDTVEKLQSRITELEELVKEMFDLCKCGYAHNYGSPDPQKLEMLAKAKSLLDGKEVTAKQIENWLH